MDNEVRLSYTMGDEQAGQRLDQALAAEFSDYSRSLIQEWIRLGWVTVDGAAALPKLKIKGGEQVEISAVLESDMRWVGQELPLTVVYEDDDVIVVDKPANLVVHPAIGNRDLTLVNALLYRFPELSCVPRAGIVHRLDKDTTGLMMVARSVTAHHALVAALQARDVKRSYETVVQGVMISGGTVDAQMGRDPVHRTKMAVINGGKRAVTHYRVIRRFFAHTHVAVELETGRTHQIRVHLKHAGYPVVGDPVYGALQRNPRGLSPELLDFLRGFGRQALHARSLEFDHPRTQEPMIFSSELPSDMKALLAQLEAFESEF